MLIILTGGTGLLGKALGRRLTEAGHRVHLLTRSPEKAGKKIPWPCEVFQWNALSPLPEGVGPKQNENWGVINLAGENIFQWPWRKTVKTAIYQSRVTGTKNLVNSLSRFPSPPRFFISAGAIGIYGEGENTNEEETPETPHLFLQKVCKDWEGEALRAGAFTRTVVLRLGYVLSGQGGFLKKQLFFLNKKMYGFLKTAKLLWISWIHEEDVLELFMWAIHSDHVKGIYNAVSPRPVTLRDFSTELCRQLNFKPWLPPFPLSLLKILGGEMVKNIFISCKAVPKKAEGQGYIFRHPDLKEALSHLLKKR